MPLVNGKIVDMELPSDKHARVIFDKSKVWRYRVLYGGRNGYKDWSFSAAAIERAVRVPTRFLFTREVQLTIAASSHQLLRDTIARLGYDAYFEILNNKITCLTTGSTLIFRGLNDLVSEDIKSTEGIDIAVINEAQYLTEKSMDDFDPTIRKPGSEIWIAFNPIFATDFIYQFCVVNPPENMIAAKVSYLDAPARYLSDVVKDRAEKMRDEYPKKYAHQYLGDPLEEGLFFAEFGEHNKEAAFFIDEDDGMETLFGGLDHGFAHPTSFTMAYLDRQKNIHAVFTYSRNGMTTREHAEAIVEQIEGCRWTHYQAPAEVFYDYAMDTKSRKNDRDYRCDLDEYRDVFREHKLSTRFIPANKRKADGCHMMRQVFDRGTGVPIFRYFNGYNNALVDSVKLVEMNTVNPEIYDKMDGDDPCDELRYLIMGLMTHRANALARENKKRRPFILSNPKINFSHALA